MCETAWKRRTIRRYLYGRLTIDRRVTIGSAVLLVSCVRRFPGRRLWKYVRFRDRIRRRPFVFPSPRRRRRRSRGPSGSSCQSFLNSDLIAVASSERSRSFARLVRSRPTALSTPDRHVPLFPSAHQSSSDRYCTSHIAVVMPLAGLGDSVDPWKRVSLPTESNVSALSPCCACNLSVKNA